MISSTCIKANSLWEPSVKCFAVHTLKFEILQSYEKIWNKEYQILSFQFFINRSSILMLFDLIFHVVCKISNLYTFVYLFTIPVLRKVGSWFSWSSTGRFLQQNSVHTCFCSSQKAQICSKWRVSFRSVLSKCKAVFVMYFQLSFSST